jgi:hypothetical protein
VRELPHQDLHQEAMQELILEVAAVAQEETTQVVGDQEDLEY